MKRYIMESYSVWRFFLRRLKAKRLDAALVSLIILLGIVGEFIAVFFYNLDVVYPLLLDLSMLAGFYTSFREDYINENYPINE